MGGCGDESPVPVENIQGVLHVSPDTLDFGAPLTTRSFLISNAGTAPLHWSVAAGAAWITADPESGTTATGPDTVMVAVDRSGLGPGRHAGKLDVRSDGGDDSVLVFADVAGGAPVLSVAPSHLDFGDSLWALSFGVSNAGGGTLTWSVTWQAAWIAVAPASGNTTVETDSVMVTVDRRGLAPGAYAGTLHVTSNGGSQDVTVAMEVSEGPLLSVAPLSLPFAVWDIRLPFVITNTGAGTLTWTCGGSSPWIAVAPASGSATTESDTVFVMVSRMGLAAGHHSGTVHIASNGGETDVAVTMDTPSGMTWYFLWGVRGQRTFTYANDGVFTGAHVTLGMFEIVFYSSPPASTPGAVAVIEDASVVRAGITIEPNSVQVNYGGIDMGASAPLPDSQCRAFLTITKYVPPANAWTPGRVSGYFSGALCRADAPIGTTDVIDIVYAPFEDIPVYGF